MTEKRYYPISRYYRDRFGEKVYKVSVSVAETCPNRRPDKPDLVCIFCDEWGSAAYHLERDKTLIEQIQTNQAKIKQRYRANKYLVYFQSYTNTLGKAVDLEKQINLALEQEQVVGVVLGTRPDCLPQKLLSVLKKLSEQHFIQVELGVQCFDDIQLNFLRRGHSAECSVNAIKKLKDETSVDVGVHLMLGLPFETDNQLINTCHLLNQLGVHNVKLHNLHVLAKTPLAELYAKGLFTPIELAEYCRRVLVFLRHLSPQIAIQRLTAVASRWDELVAPEWTKEKRRPAQFIEDQMQRENIWQGDRLQHGYSSELQQKG